MTLRLFDDADAEFTAAAQWFENQRPGLGMQFISEAIDAFIDIEHHPRRFPQVQYRGTREIRRRLLQRFPHAVVYELRATEIVVVAIAHPSRKPGYWRHRLK